MKLKTWRHRTKRVARITVGCLALCAAAAFAAEDAVQKLPLTLATNSPVTRGAMSRFDSAGEGRFAINCATTNIVLCRRLADGKLQLDTNLDGKLDDADQPPAGTNETLTVPVALGGKTWDYPVRIQYVATNYAGLESSCRFEAGSGDSMITLYEAYSMGEFWLPGKSEMAIGSSDARMRLTATPSIGGRLQALSFVDGGRALQIGPYEGMPAELEVVAEPGWAIEVALRTSNDSFHVVAHSALTNAVIPGHYRADEVRVTRVGSGLTNQIHPLGIFDFSGATNKFRVGPPYHWEFDACQSPIDPATIILDNIALVGSGGERCRVWIWEKGRSINVHTFLKSGEREVQQTTFQYG